MADIATILGKAPLDLSKFLGQDINTVAKILGNDVVLNSHLNPTWATLTGITGSPANGASYLMPSNGATHDNVIYLVNGNGSSALYNGLMAFDVVTKTWSSKTAPATSYNATPMIKLIVGGQVRLYTFGANDGLNSGTFRFATDAAKYYRPDTNSWTAITALPREAQYAMLAADQVNEKIYIAGGHYINSSINNVTWDNVSLFDANAGTYSAITAMPARKSLGFAGYYNGNLYVGGGATGNNVASLTFVDTLYKFDGASWTTLAACPKKMAYPQYVVDGQYIYIFGFYDADTAAASTLCYVFDMVAETWTALNSLNAARWGSAAFKCADGNFYLPCGFSTVRESTVLKGTP